MRSLPACQSRLRQGGPLRARTFAALLCIATFAAFVQTADAVSIFGPLGIGVWEARGTARSTAIGGADLALADSLNITVDNPAGFRSFGNTRFTATVSLSKLSAEDQFGTDRADDMRFPNVAITLPIYRSLGVGAMYQSMTDFDFLIFQNSVYDIEEPVDTLESYDLLKRLQGNGGLGRVGARVGMKANEVFTLGLGLDYWFGETEILTTLDFEQGSFVRSGRFLRHEFEGLGVELGAIAEPASNLSFGLTVRPPVTLDPRTVLIIEGGDSTGLGSSSYSLPWSYAGSASYSIERIRGSLFGRYEPWKDLELDVANDYPYNNRVVAGFGIERLRRTGPLLPWYEAMEFRAGLRWEQHYVQAGGEPLRSTRISFGAGIPISRGRGLIDAAFWFDQRGSIDTNGARERIYGMQLSVTSSERWFVRRDD